MTGYIVILVSVLFYAGLFAWVNRPRQWNQKARLERRLLVEEQGNIVWRTVRARYLVGLPNSHGVILPVRINDTTIAAMWISGMCST